MPRKTIKKLEETIAELRELRQGDRDSSMTLRLENQKLKDQVVARGLEIEELRKDRTWLRSLCQQLSAAVTYKAQNA